MGKRMDLVGQKFGRLTVVSFAEVRNKNSYWNCICECGNKVQVLGCNLKRGHTKSCGCLASELSSIRGEKRGGHYVGETAGNWQLIRKTDKRSLDQCIIWVAKCTICGREREFPATYLSAGNQNRLPICECIATKSKGELKIAGILDKNNILYEKEYSFLDLKDKKRLRFDFRLNDGTLIEYDGIQHFQYRNDGWNTEERYLETVRRDKMKNEYCFKNKIPLIRIPYTHYKDLCLEDLLKDTSTFLLRKEDYV